MNFIQNSSIRNKLLVLGLAPLLALFYFLGINIKDKIKDRETIERVSREVLFSERMSNVVHQLQQERGYSMAYIIVKGQQEKAGMFAQRERTDEAVKHLSQFLLANDQLKDHPVREEISLLRNKINSPATDPDAIQKLFAGMLLALIDDINKTALLSQNPKVKSLLNAHIYLIYGKEYFGQLRNELMQTALDGKFKNNGFAEFASLKGSYEMNLAAFRRNTSVQLAAYYDKESQRPDYANIIQIMDAVFYDPFFSKKFSAEEIWTSGVAHLNSLKQIEDNSSKTVRETARNLLAEISDSMVESIVLAFFLVLLLIILLYKVINSMVNSILELRSAADRISRGELELTVNVKSKDEIGSLGHAFNQLIKISREYAHVAEIIGRGDYSPVIKIRSSSDTLGISLNNMKNNLHMLSLENESRTWLLSGNSELNNRMRGEKDAGELAGEVISKLTTYLDAQVGAIYLAENGSLVLAGSHAFPSQNHDKLIEFGQGLVGQAAKDKRVIIMSEIPEDYVRISSGLGDSLPRHIIVFPFMHEKQVKGVIEIGSLKEFSPQQIEYLNLVAENIGISFHSSQSRTLLKELLEETQRQTEELEAQQEELRQINEELHEKTSLLERSEAELKAQHEELQQSNEELGEKASLLEEQKEALELAKMEVETKARELELNSRYKSEFLANMSHELRTPLNSILILAQLLAENKSRVLAEKEVSFAQNIYTSGTDLLTLINEILDLSKVESGKIELDISTAEISDISGNLHSLFKELANVKSVDFDIKTAEDDFQHPFITDQQRLEQILKNLLSNAFKFTDKGGRVSLDIAIIPGSEVALTGNLKKLDRVVAFGVKDSGIGIPAEKQAMIFEAFQQADGSTKRKYGGTGLGLSISRELARALGGEIQLQSEEGKGSVFTLYLPLEFDESIIEPVEREVMVIKPDVRKLVRSVPDVQLAGDSGDDRHIINEKDKVILIIEDDPLFSEILLDFIRRKGYKGVLAMQGNAGLSLARHYRPDAIILDMKLPVMDGSQVLKHLKNDPELRHIPVQVVSGYDRRKEGFELGAFDFVRKPLNQADLDSAFGRIEEFINKKLKKLLVVEDNMQQNMAIRELIGNGDVDSFSAYTGEEAHRMMLNERFDCVIIDLGLPDMSGIDLMERLKSDEQLKGIPVIVYTGKDLSRQEAVRLNKLANTVVLKTADSNERLLDETTLFLHRVESKLPREKQDIIRRLHRTDEVLKDKKVLIVDDDMRNIYSLTNALEEEGVRCITAENGIAAIQVLKDQPDTHIVLMDVMMPEMDGYEATREIRRIEKFNKLPILALTAKAMKGDREKCLEAGMSDYIAKPVNMEKLLSLMRVWLYQ